MQLFCRRKLEEDDRERERQENAEKLKKVERRMEREQRRRAAKAKQKDQVRSMFFHTLLNQVANWCCAHGLKFATDRDCHVNKKSDCDCLTLFIT